MDNQNETINQTPKPRTSKLAIASFVMGLLCLVTCVLWPILALPAIICGIIALVKIGKANGMLKGKGYAITGLILTGMMVVLIPVLAILLAILMPALNKTKHIAQRVVCGTNLKGLGCALIVYANDYNDLLPPADQWCDLLITQVDVSPKSLICPDSDTSEGESSYAMNIHAASKNLNQLPPDMVLFFEIETDKASGLRNTPIQSRAFYELMEGYDSEWIDRNKGRMVYPNQWNQSGGSELLSTQSHKGEGCNILFVDGHASWIPASEIPTLRWTAEELATQPVDANSCSR